MQHHYPLFRRLAATLGLALAATAGHAQFTYCTPVSSSPCMMPGDYLNSFSVDGGMPQTISNLNTGCSPNTNHYTFYNTLYADAPQGGIVNWTAANGGEAMYYRVWVDWNNDGAFTDAGELMGDTSIGTSSSYTGAFAVPATATLGEHRLRVAGSWNMTYFHACDTFWYGETEDYILNVTTSGVPCVGTPDGGQAMAMPSSYCPGQPVVLHVENNSTGAGITIQWESSMDGGATWSSIPTATTEYYTIVPTSAACYRAAITCTGSGTVLTSYSASTCITEAGPATCGADSVWPGDANDDLIANNFDAFSIYLNYGETGAARAMISTTWAANDCADWSSSAFGPNAKHADCNGDGTVDSTDLVAISANYGLTHSKPGHNAYKGTGLPDLYPDFTGITLMPGATVTVPIRLGTAASAVTAVYAIAGTVSVSGGATLTTPLSATMSTSGMLGSSVEPFTHSTSTSSIAWAAGRTNGTDATGYGQIGSVTFTVPAGTPSGTAMIVMLNDVQMIDHMGMPVTDFNVMNDTATVQSMSVSHTATGIRQAAVYPNPAAGAAMLSFSADAASAGTLRVTDIAGRVLTSQPIAIAAGHQEVALPVATLPVGAYFAELRTAQGGTQVVRFVKQ